MSPPNNRTGYSISDSISFVASDARVNIKETWAMDRPLSVRGQRVIEAIGAGRRLRLRSGGWAPGRRSPPPTVSSPNASAAPWCAAPERISSSARPALRGGGDDRLATTACSSNVRAAGEGEPRGDGAASPSISRSRCRAGSRRTGWSTTGSSRRAAARRPDGRRHGAARDDARGRRAALTPPAQRA